MGVARVTFAGADRRWKPSRRSFASRNNVVDGSWAIGLILAELPPDHEYRIDLVSGEAVPGMKEHGLATWDRLGGTTFDGRSPNTV